MDTMSHYDLPPIEALPHQFDFSSPSLYFDLPSPFDYKSFFTQAIHSSPSSCLDSPYINGLSPATHSLLDEYHDWDFQENGFQSRSSTTSWPCDPIWDGYGHPLCSDAMMMMDTGLLQYSSPITLSSSPRLLLSSEMSSLSSQGQHVVQPELMRSSRSATPRLSPSAPTTTAEFNSAAAQSSSPVESPTSSRSGSPSSCKKSASSSTTRKRSAAHNDVEKRYRNNLSLKLAELSASIPSRGSDNVNVDDDEMDEESRSTSKNTACRSTKKAAILSRATQYIKLLEADRTQLLAENKVLKKNLSLCGQITGEGLQK